MKTADPGDVVVHGAVAVAVVAVVEETVAAAGAMVVAAAGGVSPQLVTAPGFVWERRIFGN